RLAGGGPRRGEMMSGRGACGRPVACRVFIMNDVSDVVFLLVEDFSHLAFACALEPLRIANFVADRELYRWRLASADGRSAICSNRAVTLVDHDLTPLERGEALFLISGINVQHHV